MPITLKITSYQRLTPDHEESFTSDLNRFSVGRKDGNHWTLPDPQRFMSGTHCWFENRNGTWYVTDTSTNGVFVNKSDQRINKNDSVEIHHGDAIRIGDYDLDVEIGAGSAEATGIAPDFAANPFGGDSAAPGSDSLDSGPLGSDLGSGDMGIDNIIGAPASDSPAEPLRGAEEHAYLKDVNTPLSEMDDSLLGDPVSIDDLYDLGEDKPAESAPTLGDTGGQGPALRQNYTAPETHSAPTGPADDRYGLDLSEIPENWDDDSLADEVPTPEPPSPPSPQATPPAQQPEPEPPAAPPKPAPAPATASPAPVAGSHLAAFTEGAGLDTAQLRITDEAEFFRELGGLFKIMTEGLMQVIASRNQIKSEFRLEQTMIAPTDNNPFKFSASAHEAMTRLFNQGDKAYLSGLVATEEAVDDISAHQMAVLAGTEAALRDILRRFRPDKLEERFGKSSLLGKAMPALEKARCWDFFKVLYDEVSEAADDDFQQLFGSEFSNAYEEQLERLKLARRENS